MISALALVISVLAFLPAVGTWNNIMPWCDVKHVEPIATATSVRLSCIVKNGGSGKTKRADITLLEYGGARNIPHSQSYLGPLTPGEENPFESMWLDLGDHDGDAYRVLMKWSAPLGLYGETYISSGYDDGRPRVRMIYWPQQFWRWMTRYREE